MISIILTYRNRNLAIVEKCLNSLAGQTNKGFSVVLVDYGSDGIHSRGIQDLAAQFPFVTLLQYPVAQQLWCKSRAINIALKKVFSEYVLVGDIDMLYAPTFTETLHQLKNPGQVHYFIVGFLSKEESVSSKEFGKYAIKHFSNHEATGISLFPKQKLMDIGGFDEFYHGWGSEDTDVHVRLKNTGVPVVFFDAEVLVLHQWHPKTYRSNQSEAPYHTGLEKLNASYLKNTLQLGITEANTHQDWGIEPTSEDYEMLKKPTAALKFSMEQAQVLSIIPSLKNSYGTIDVLVEQVSQSERFKQRLKAMLGKKHKTYVTIDEVNDVLLFEIIRNFRNAPYIFRKNETSVAFTINLQQP